MSLLLFRLYQRWLSPLLHAFSGVSGACRFQPTCSEYAAIALHTHGLAHGGWLTAKRLLRCHPLCRGGFDPVPPGGQPSATGGDQNPLHLP